MKNCVTLFLLFSITIVSSQIKSGKVTYVVSMTPFSEKKIDSLTKTSKVKNVKVKNWMKSVLRNSTPIKAFLEFTNTESLYNVEQKMQNDGKPILNMNTTFAGGDNIYYKNLNTKEFYHQSDIFDELSLIEIPKKNWQLTQESKIIAGYLCYKAIDLSYKSKSTYAWFTPQIPVSFGPKVFADLPGLVLEVVLKKRKIVATKIILNPKKEIKIIKPTEGKKVTAEEAKRRYKAFWKSIEKQ